MLNIAPESGVGNGAWIKSQHLRQMFGRKMEEHVCNTHPGPSEGSRFGTKRAKTRDGLAQLAEFACGLCLADLSQRVLEHALRVVRDTLGSMLAGATLPEIRKLVHLAAELGGHGRASLVGHSQTTSPCLAALVNGTGGVSLELDEGNQYAVNHPAIHVLPAVLALTEEQGGTGMDLLVAFVAGYEVAVRVGRATHLRRAVHPFGTHAIVGVAAAAARLLGLDAEQIAQAMELAAGITVASSQTAANSGASVRNLATGLTVYHGMSAPMLVQAGFTGETGALDVVFGRILGDSFETEWLGDGLRREFYLTRNYFKLHACSRWNHAPIEAVAALQGRMPFEAEEVAQIIVWTFDPATRLDHRDPVNGYAAKHSIPYNVAVRVVRGTNDLQAYTVEAVNDPRVRALAKLVAVREDPELTAMLPDVRPARVEVKLRSGITLTETVERPRGGFDNPVTEGELSAKFRRLAGLALPSASVTELESLLPTLPALVDLSPLSRVLQGRWP